jgi:hypothetical protein
MLWARLMLRTILIPVTKMYAAAFRWGLYWAIGCLAAIYLWTPTALGGNIAGLNLESNFRLIQSVFLLVIVGLVFHHGLAMGKNPVVSETRFLSGRTLSCSSKAVRT